MPDPQMPGSFEQREQTVEFVAMEGRRMGNTGDEPGKPVAWFVRPKGAPSTWLSDLPPGSFGRMVAELYGEESMNFHVGLTPGKKSDDMLEKARRFAQLISTPETQRKIRELIRRRAEFAEAIRQAEANIQRDVDGLASVLGREPSRPRVWEVKN